MLLLLAALCVGVGSQQAGRERFITLRDYDFVGEDATLAAQLSRRLALLQAPLNLSELQPPARPARPDVWRRWRRPPEHIKPDYLDSNLKLPQMVNVSLDYAEIFNASESDWSRDINGSSSAPAPAAVQGPGPGAALVPSPGATLVPGPYAAVARDLDSALGPNPAEGPSPDLSPGATPAPSERLGSVDGRRQAFDPWNHKVLDLMKQNIYGTQRKILELDNVIKKFQWDPRFRMAYIYSRLDEWMHNLRTLHYAMYKWRYYHLRVKRLIWYYEHSLRINIDITYSIEHLVHLHEEYMKKMELVMPLSTRLSLEAAKRAQRKQKKMREMGFPEGYVLS